MQACADDPSSSMRARPHPEHGGFLIKALILLVLVVVIFGGAALVGYRMFIKPQQEIKAESAFGTPTPPPDPTVPEFEKLMAIKNQGRLVEARAALENFIANNPASTKLEAAKDALGDCNVQIFLTGTPAPEKEAYTIQKGDVLAKIEKKMKAPGELIMRSNGIDDPRRLRVGDVLYVSHPQFSLIISRKLKKVVLYNHGKFFKQYTPRSWTAPVSKNTAPIAAKVTDVASFKNGQRVAYGTRDFGGGTHTIQISASGFSIHTDPAEGGEKVAAGIVLSEEETAELSALLSRGVPVTIE